MTDSDNHNSGSSDNNTDLEKIISRWRSWANSHQGIDDRAVQRIDRDLRVELNRLSDAELMPDEVLLIAAKRVGRSDSDSAAFAQECFKLLWSDASSTAPAHATDAPVHTADTPDADEGTATLGDKPSDAHPVGVPPKRDFLVMAVFACAAAVAVKVPEIFDISMDDDGSFYGRNLSLLILPMMTGYFAWLRGLRPAVMGMLALLFAVAAVFANAYPFAEDSHTEVLTAIHLPILMWLVAGVAHTGGRWHSHHRRMDFVRFTGEWVVYYALIALGGGVFTGSTVGVFHAIGLDIDEFAGMWLMPCGAAGAVIVAAWLAETRRGAASIAPVLARMFTPLFTAMLLSFLLAVTITRRGIDIDRGVLISFDVLLALILGLLVYSASARDTEAPPGWFDRMQAVLVVSALITDALVLTAIASRLADFGLSANRVAALGENLILLVNLAWSACLYTGFLTGRGSPFSAVKRWQTHYTPVYAAWAAVVVVVFPPAFGFA